jgi:hypothetical protein
MIVTVQPPRYLDGHCLYLTFNTGEAGTVDLQDLVFKCNAASPLTLIILKPLNLDEWSTIVWDCGFDVSPETFYARATGKLINWQHAQLVLSTES